MFGDSFNLLNTIDTIFFFVALLGSGLFIIQLFFSAIGAADIGDVEAIDPSSTDISTDSSQQTSDVNYFKWVSIQTIAGFMMMFGWTAIACHHEMGLSLTAATLISFFVGMLTVITIRQFFKLAIKLHSPGSAFSIDKAIGKEGYVYQRITPEGIGKVTLTINQLTYEIDAVTGNGEEVPSFTQVRIINKIDDLTVVVIPVR